MNLPETLPEITGSITLSAATIWFFSRLLISYYFSKQKELKEMESKLSDANDKLSEMGFRNLIGNLEKDINGLGAKLREFELKLDGRIKELIKLETQNLKGQ